MSQSDEGLVKKGLIENAAENIREPVNISDVANMKRKFMDDFNQFINLFPADVQEEIYDEITAEHEFPDCSGCSAGCNRCAFPWLFVHTVSNAQQEPATQQEPAAQQEPAKARSTMIRQNSADQSSVVDTSMDSTSNQTIDEVQLDVVNNSVEPYDEEELIIVTNQTEEQVDQEQVDEGSTPFKT